MPNAKPAPKPAARGEDIVPTGPGTIAGRYLRRFWQPIYHGVDLPAGDAVKLRILSEDWTLYRGAGGEVHLIDARCPHRGALLSIGRIEGEELRCFYHGWKFAGDGRCTEQPAEDSAFCQKVAIRSAPVREYLGLVFAYFGPISETPDFPLYPEFDRFDGLVEIDSYSRDCNYFQNLENALDMSHVGFVHGDNDAVFDGLGHGKRLAAAESGWGVTYTFTRDDGQIRIQQFGMPNIFYMNALPTDPDIGWQESLFWWVPIDDVRHMQFSLHRVPATGAVAERIHDRRQARRSRIDVPHQQMCAQILAGALKYREVDQTRVDMIRLQDDLAQCSQGVVADREAEFLGRADIGVIAIRRLWARELAALRAGRALTTWSRNPTLTPRIWGRTAPQAISGTANTPSASTPATPTFVDVRPYVEIQEQLKALSG